MGEVLQLSRLLNEKCLFFNHTVLASPVRTSSLSPIYSKPQIKSGYWSTQSRQSVGFFSSRPNWDSPTPSPAGERAPPPRVRGGGTHSLARGGLGVPIPSRGHTLTRCTYVLCTDDTCIFYSGIFFCHIILECQQLYFWDTEYYGKNLKKAFAVIAIVAQNLLDTMICRNVDELRFF